MRILIAEDSDLYLQMYTSWFQEWKYTFDLATDGQKALELAQKNSYDLVITDVEMPNLNGVQLLEALKEKGIKVPVLVISGTDRDVILDCLKLGAVDYLIKPFNSALLQRKLVKLLVRDHAL